MRRAIGLCLPVLTIIGVVVAAQKLVFESRYDVSGHTAEHLSSASAPFAGLAAVSVILLCTSRARRDPIVLIAAAGWLTSTVLVSVGNIRVVDSLVLAGMSDTPTSRLVQTSAIESAHGLANLAPWLGVLTAVGFAIALWRRCHVTGRVAMASVILSALFPPWLIPGAGVVVLAVSQFVAAARDLPDVTLLAVSDQCLTKGRESAISET